MAKKKPESGVMPFLKDQLRFALHDEEGSRLYPILFELLAPHYAEDTLKRQEGRLSIVPSGSQYLVTIECPTEKVSTSIEVQSLAGIFEALEAILRDHKCHWKLHYKKRKKDLTRLNRAE